jgi:hypothetical protein
MGFNRRTFLHKIGLSLLTLGASQNSLVGFERYHQAIAAPTPRKLALLVGINEYTDANLKGCLTDVELQRELLVNRFGFQGQDILTLTGQQATRDAIENAFVEHLSEQAKPGDVVVFHFSGYGRQVATDARLVNSLMPSDSLLPTKTVPATNDLLEETLILLGRSLDTEKLTLVLDTSYDSPGGLLQGNLRVRSFPNLGEKPSLEELSFQQRLQNHLKTNAFSGTILAAAAREGIASEIAIEGMNAGLFTYALTQYLWEAAPASRIFMTMKRASQQMAIALGNEQAFSKINTDKQSVLTYYLLPKTAMGAEGIVTRVEDERSLELKLTGLPLEALKHYGDRSCFSLFSASPDASKQLPSEQLVQIRSRDGLKAKAKLLDRAASPYVGQLAREVIRVLPRQIGLTVALAPSLERIERVDATSAFASIAAVSEAIAAGEASADCLLGKAKDVSTKLVAFFQDKPVLEEGYGLYTVAGAALPYAKSASSEAVKSAIAHLDPQFQQLLAAKWWRMTQNEGSSRLPVSASLEIVGKPPQVLLRRDTRIAEPVQNLSWAANSDVSEAMELPRLSEGTLIQYRLENASDRPLYFLLLGIDSSGSAIALYAPRLVEETELSDKSFKLKDQIILPGEQLVVPRSSDSFDLKIAEPPGLSEIQIVFASAPFSKTLEALSEIDYLKGDREQIFKLPNPLAVARSLLQDLHTASAVKSELINSTNDVYALDTKAWATLSFVYQVV